jgi:hypothetical protein
MGRAREECGECVEGGVWDSKRGVRKGRERS